MASVEAYTLRVQFFTRYCVQFLLTSTLLSYDTACVRIRSADGEVRLEGKNLSIPYFGTEDMIVAGKIERVCFEGEPA